MIEIVGSDDGVPVTVVSHDGEVVSRRLPWSDGIINEIEDVSEFVDCHGPYEVVPAVAAIAPVRVINRSRVDADLEG